MNIYGIIMIFLSYLIGSIPVGYIIVRKKTGKDVRTFGSGVTGSTNVSRICGRRWGIITAIADFLKGFLPTATAISVLGMDFITGLVGVAAVIGHNYPVFIPPPRFKGGKGVATTAGFIVPVLLLILFKYPYPWIYGMAIGILLSWIAIIKWFKRMSAASIFLVSSLLVFFGLVVIFTRSSFSPYLFFEITFTIGLVLWNHRENWRRLYRGKERTIESSWEK